MINKHFEKKKTADRRDAIVRKVFGDQQTIGTTPIRAEIARACGIPSSSMGALLAELEEDHRISILNHLPLSMKIAQRHPKNTAIIRDWRKHQTTTDLQQEMHLPAPFDTMCGDVLDLTEEVSIAGPEQPPLTEPMYTMRNAPTSALIYELVERGYVVSKGR